MRFVEGATPPGNAAFCHVLFSHHPFILTRRMVQELLSDIQTSRNPMK